MIIKPDHNHWTLLLKPAGLISTLVIAFLFSTVVYSQPVSEEKIKERAVAAFSGGDFEKALDDFGQLLKTFPADPYYKYCYGVSLVKLKKETVKASSILAEAMEGSSSIKKVPDDGWFYLGRARQMSGEFEEAVKSFNTFSDLAGRRKARKLDTESYIKQCRNQEGMLSREQLLREASGTGIGDRGIKGETAGGRNEVPASSLRPNKPREYLSDEDDRLLSDAFDNQVKADSLQKIVSASGTATGPRAGIGQAGGVTQKSDVERAADLNQREADRIFSGLEKENQTGTGADVKGATTDDGKSVTLPEASPDKGLVKQKQDEGIQQQNDSTVIFGIVNGRVLSPDEMIKINVAVPPGLVYRIQMAVFRNPVSQSLFRGINPVYGIRADGTDITYYYAGYFRKNADAQKALTLVRQEGMKDAFVVAVMDGKPVSLERAAALEKEWGNVPFETNKVKKVAPVSPKDEIPPELSFRVEITRSEKPLGEDVVEGYRMVSGKRGFEILNADDNKVVYLIGKFITFESAEEYAGLLKRNGYSDAKVSAWLGKKEIPVETAKQLFEMTE